MSNPGPQCGATNRAGTPCQQTAGWGTDHAGVGRCKLHGGASPAGRKAAQRVIAADAVVTFGLPRDVDPATALLEEVARTAGAIAWLQGKIRALPEGELVETRTVPADGTMGRAMVSVWLELYARERSHLVRCAAAAIAGGVAERQVRLAEAQGEILADVIRGILTDLDLSAEQEARVHEVVPRHLRAVG
jgi:hypothetical protein